MKQISLIFLFFAFLTVIATGLYGFFQPFTLKAMTLHVTFGFIFILSIGLHLFERRKALKRLIQFKNTFKFYVISGVLYITLLYIAFESFLPVKILLSLAYENQHREEVFRSSPDVVYDQINSTHKVLKQTEEFEAFLEVQLNEQDEDLYLAIWAEDDFGNMIEPLFITDNLRHSHKSRVNVLPVWSKRFKKMHVKPEEVDGVSTATIRRSFKLNHMIKNRKHGFHLKIEINALNDENKIYHSKSDNFMLQSPEDIGQPSVIYTAFVDFHDELVDSWFLLKFEGKSDVSGEEGDIIPDSYGLTSARHILERAMLKVDYVK